MSITTQRAREFGIDPQQEGEGDSTFRNRVANALRKRGHLIEAHEAQSNALYDDPEGNAMVGITGAIVQALQGTHYRGDPIGNDIAAGVVASKKRDKDREAMLLMQILKGR